MRLDLITTVLLLVGILAACGKSDVTPEPGNSLGPKIGDATLDTPFASFRDRALNIDRLESAVVVPLTPGSTASSATLVSDVPDIVTVVGDGSLVAHRNGKATVRGVPGGGVLEVTVLASAGLRADPAELDLSPGTASLPVLRTVDGLVPSGAATWYSTTPQVAMVEDGRIRAGPTKGVALLTAVYGGEQVRITVRVGAKRNSK
jgi:hypothetical protein